MASRLANRSKISFSTSWWRSSGRSILLIDDDRPQAALQRLGDHELGLRQRAFGGVDQHDDAVDHVQDALDLAAEIGVAGRVDDVDARVLPDDEVHLARMVMPRSRSRSLVSMAALGHLLVLAEGAGLLQQLVDERGLAVVDVGDDRDVAKLHNGVSSAGTAR